LLTYLKINYGDEPGAADSMKSFTPRPIWCCWAFAVLLFRTAIRFGELNRILSGSKLILVFCLLGPSC